MFWTVYACALEVPDRPTGYINDNADLISSSLEQRLARGLSTFEKERGVQIVVVTFESLEGENLEEFSIRLAEKWQIGKKQTDSGVILLIFAQDRQVRIEVGYGLEATLTDLISSRIIDNIMVPAFREAKMDVGIFDGVLSIMDVLMATDATSSDPNLARQEYSQEGPRALTPEEIAQLRNQAKAITYAIFVCVALFFVIDLFRYRNYANSHKGYLSHYSFWEWWFRFAILLFILNLIFRMLFYAMLFSRGGRYGGRSGFGGFSGGGGGSFGGGGASGRW